MPAPLQDLDRATWAEVPRDLYMVAAKYLVAHNVAYQGVTVSEENARQQFFQLGATCGAVRAQATQVATSETMPVKLDAPGDSSADGCVIAVKEAVVKDEVETQLESTADFSGVESIKMDTMWKMTKHHLLGFSVSLAKSLLLILMWKGVARSLLRSCLCCRLGHIVSAVWKIWKSNYRV